MNNKMIIADELTAAVMVALGWSFDGERDTLVDKDNEPIGWDQSDCLLLAEPITYNGVQYQQINVWGDGTMEFQDMTDGDSYNWNDFDEELIQMMYDAVMAYQHCTRYDATKQTYTELIAECVDYAKENQDSNYMAELNQIDADFFSKENWQTLIYSGVFHDAIGKLVQEEETYIIVAEEY